jgi:hypothetical protein
MLLANNDEEPRTNQADITVHCTRVVFDENATYNNGDIDFAMPITPAAVDERGPESTGQVLPRLWDTITPEERIATKFALKGLTPQEQQVLALLQFRT